MRTLLFLILAAWVAPLTASAQPAPAAPPATTRRCALAACIETAVRNHPLQRSGQAQEAEARAFLQQRKAEWLPELSMGATLGYLDGEAVAPSTALRGIEQRSVSGAYWGVGPNLEIPIFAEGSLVGQTSPGLRAGELGVTEKEWLSRAVRVQVATRVAEAYIDLLKSQRAVEVNDRLVAVGDSAYRLAVAQHQRNLISRTDLLAAEVRVATAKQERAVAQLAADRARRGLAIAMGLPNVNERIEVEEVVDESPVSQDVELLRARVRESHPEVKAREFRVLQAREEVKRAERERWGKISADLGYSYIDDFDPSGPSQFYAGVKYRIPLWDFGRIKERANVFRARADAEEQMLENLRLTLDRDVTDLYYRAGELAARSERVQKQIEQAEEALKLSRSRQQQGLVSPAVVAESEAALLRLRLEQDGLENDRKLALVRLQLLSGR